MARNYRTPCPVLAGSGVCVAPQDRVPVPFWPGGGPGMQPAQLLAQAVSHGIALASSWPSSLEETATETGCRAPQRWGARGTLGEPSCWMEQLCGTQTPSGSALPLAPCLPRNGAGPTRPRQPPPVPSRTRTPGLLSKSHQRVTGALLSPAVHFHPRRRDLALFSQPGHSEFGRWAIGGTRTALCSCSSPAEARG